MKFHVLILVATLVLAFSARAADKPARSRQVGTGEPSLHLTGNPRVDFFSSRTFALADTNRQYYPVLLSESSEGADEKSPWLAGLLSLAVPGAGEVYAESYVKGALFFAVEVASWAVILSYNKKGDDQTALYKAYADAHYSPIRYAQWLGLYLDANGRPANYDSLFFNGAPNPNAPPPFSQLNWTNLNRVESQVGEPGFSHQLPLYGEQQYFELIGKYQQFKKGWDTQDPSDPTYTQEKHQQMRDYAEMFNQADRYYNTATSFVSVVVVNHILSAVDAIWSVSRYNKSLHADVRMHLQPSPLGLVPVTQARVQYDF